MSRWLYSRAWRLGASVPLRPDEECKWTTDLVAPRSHPCGRPAGPDQQRRVRTV